MNESSTQLKESLRSTRNDIQGHAEVEIVNAPFVARKPRQQRRLGQNAEHNITVEAGSTIRQTKRRRAASSQRKQKGGWKRAGRKRWGRGRASGKAKETDGRGAFNNGAWGGNSSRAWDDSPHHYGRQEDKAFEGFGAEIKF